LTLVSKDARIITKREDVITMIYTYEELKKQKEEGTKLDWNNISRDQLANLFFVENISNNAISDLYDVSSNKVKYKRGKLDIKLSSNEYYNHLYKEALEAHPYLQETAKENLLQEQNIPIIAKAITHYIFRNGPVEDMHAEGKFSNDDMKKLNKFMVNRIAGLLKLALDGDWIKLELMIEILKNYGGNWDEVEYDTQEIEEYFKFKCNQNN